MKTCPKCKKRKSIIAVEYAYGSSERYDGISEYWCMPAKEGCGYRQGRWTGFELKEGEIEYRLGQEPVHKKGRTEYIPARKPKYVGLRG